MAKPSKENKKAKKNFNFSKKIRRTYPKKGQEKRRTLHIINVRSAPPNILAEANIIFECDDLLVNKLFQIKDRYKVIEKLII